METRSKVCRLAIKNILVVFVIAAIFVLPSCAQPSSIGVSSTLRPSSTPQPSTTLPQLTPSPPTLSTPTPPVPLPIAQQTPADFTSAVAALLPSVVMIDVTYSSSGRGQPAGAAGTGWVYAKNGFIVTNNHVVTGAQTITITFENGTKYTAVGVQADIQSDLAVIKVNSTNLKPVTLGDSSKLVLGQPVAMMGNAMDLGIHVTAGIVSNLNISINVNNTPLNGLIETDAVINPGNSGGILFTRTGEVVGIPNAGLDDPTIDPENFGYAININSALPIINQLISQFP